MKEEKEYCKFCGKELNQNNDYQQYCFLRMVFHNFTGEYNSWDEIEKAYISELKKQGLREIKQNVKHK